MEKLDITNYSAQLSSLHPTDIQLVLYGSDTPNSTYDRYKFGRKSCGIIIVLDGTVEYTFDDGDVLSLSKGEIILFSAESKYTLKVISEQEFVHYTVNFTFANGESLPFGRLVIKPQNFFDFTALFKKLLKERNNFNLISKFRCLALLNQIIADFFKCALQSEITNEQYKKVLSAIKYINENYCEKITIDDLAKLCMMSNSHFRRTFTQMCGVSPIEYLVSIRIQRAKELIIESTLPVSSIASLCGFKDEEYFCRTFKKRTGKTVRQMRMNQ